jgi:hypothetical protein
MTKSEAIIKIRKMLNLAKGSKGPESDLARTQAEKMMAQYGINPSDLASEEKALAFDALVDRLQAYVNEQGATIGLGGLFDSMGVIKEVLAKIKGLGAADKANRLQQVTDWIQGATFLIGPNNNHIRSLNQILSDVLKEHGLNT